MRWLAIRFFVSVVRRQGSRPFGTVIHAQTLRWFVVEDQERGSCIGVWLSGRRCILKADSGLTLWALPCWRITGVRLTSSLWRRPCGVYYLAVGPSTSIWEVGASLPSQVSPYWGRVNGCNKSRMCKKALCRTPTTWPSLLPYPIPSKCRQEWVPSAHIL